MINSQSSFAPYSLSRETIAAVAYPRTKPGLLQICHDRAFTARFLSIRTCAFDFEKLEPQAETIGRSRIQFKVCGDDQDADPDLDPRLLASLVRI